MVSIYSITVTSVPSREYMLPISNPITPAPITTIDLGIFDSAKAPVDETIRFSSILTFGMDEGFDPAAITIFLRYKYHYQ